MEYLESYGVEYINTGIYLDSESSVTCELTPIDRVYYHIPFGNDMSNFFCVSVYHDSQYPAFAYGSEQARVTSYTFPIGYRTIIRKNGPYNYINENLIYTNTPQSFRCKYPCFLFCPVNENNGLVNTQAGYKGRIHHFSITKGDELQLNFIPALDIDNIPCMFDTVSQTAFYNSGRGAFGYPFFEDEDEDTIILPAGYERLGFLENFGTSYINTGIIVTEKHGISIKHRPSSSLGDANVDGAGTIFMSPTHRNISSTGYCWGNGWVGMAELLNLDIIAEGRLNYMNDKKAILQDMSSGGIIHKLLDDKIFTSTLPYTIFWGQGGDSSGYYFKGRIYRVKISYLEKLIHDFIPAIAPNGELCMYDIIENKAYFNAGGGTFSGGNAVS